LDHAKIFSYNLVIVHLLIVGPALGALPKVHHRHGNNTFLHLTLNSEIPGSYESLNTADNFWQDLSLIICVGKAVLILPIKEGMKQMAK
jgi:hypothetical protein